MNTEYKAETTMTRGEYIDFIRHSDILYNEDYWTWLEWILACRN